MMTSKNPLAPGAMRLVAGAAMILTLVGCSKAAPADKGPRIELTAEARSGIDRALGAYDDIRSKLASDQIAVSGDAQRLEQAAADASKDVPPSLRPTLESLSAAARDLQRADQDDPGAVREAFGNVSRATIALVGADSTLSEGRQVYECSMRKGYGKWIQTTDKIANPYMGSGMLECGAEVAWDENP
ncbi:MAG: hypothetical protein OER77_05345 [Myxococcales bacterium]|nr:hypothetical protein [Myxococcales bacterium]